MFGRIGIGLFCGICCRETVENRRVSAKVRSEGLAISLEGGAWMAYSSNSGPLWVESMAFVFNRSGVIGRRVFFHFIRHWF